MLKKFKNYVEKVDITSFKKNLAGKLPIKATKKMGDVWQKDLNLDEVELDLMKDPFAIPKVDRKLKVIFTRSKVITDKKIEP